MGAMCTADNPHHAVLTSSVLAHDTVSFRMGDASLSVEVLIIGCIAANGLMRLDAVCCNLVYQAVRKYIWHSKLYIQAVLDRLPIRIYHDGCQDSHQLCMAKRQHRV
jgi:hypothetical protein